ncbi:MAG: hypothetical protein H8E98_07155 [Bacteroidetes bacterium]|nr:hypothetical protein [Bacteroidota bacterium]
MKKSINIRVTDNTNIIKLINYYNESIAEKLKYSTDFELVNSQIVKCIEDFQNRAKILARAGTKIHIEKEFRIEKTKILVTLEYPVKKVSLLRRFLKY